VEQTGWVSANEYYKEIQMRVCPVVTESETNDIIDHEQRRALSLSCAFVFLHRDVLLLE